MFNNFPTKPVPHSPRLRQSRQAHRSAVIYEPNLHKLPARPQPVWPQPERPVPVIQLPGLPPRSVPKSIVKSGSKGWSEASKKYVSNESFSGVELTFFIKLAGPVHSFQENSTSCTPNTSIIYSKDTEIRCKKTQSSRRFRWHSRRWFLWPQADSSTSLQERSAGRGAGWLVGSSWSVRIGLISLKLVFTLTSIFLGSFLLQFCTIGQVSISSSLPLNLHPFV